MSARRVGIATLSAAVAVAAAAGAGAGAAAAGGPARVSVSVDRKLIATTLGHKFRFRSTFTNRGPAAAAGLIAHLNILSLHSDVYVDPEDWSSHRTRYLGPIPRGGAVTVTWPMEAVNHGSFAVYVTLVPDSGAPRPPAIGPAIKVAVADRRSLDAGGIVPLALGVPAFLGLLLVGVRARRRA
jgi:hypothetical protein